MTAIVYRDPGNLASDAVDASLVHAMQAALWKWGQKVAFDAPVNLTTDNTITTAATGGMAWGEINVRINPVYAISYTDLNSSWLPGDPIADGKDAADYWALHEIGHALGINYQAMGPWAVGAFYTGPHAMAAYGGPVPITQDGQSGHLGHSMADGVAWDIMSGIAPHRHFEQVISAVDIAIIVGDEGRPAAISNDRLTELYLGSFNRAPDQAGLAYWESQMAAGMSLQSIAASFFTQPEMQALYPVGQPVATFVDAVYGNVLGRPADAPGMAYWSDALQTGVVSRDGFLLAVLSGAQGSDREHLDHAVMVAEISLIGVVFA